MEKKDWVWILIVASLWIFFILLSIKNRQPTPAPEKETLADTPPPNDMSIPKIIYTFWNSDKLPAIVEKSIETWKKHCPGYEIRIMNYENTKHMGIRHKETHARYADFARLYCLEETGGVWIDASVFLQRPLDDWMVPGYDYTGYYAEYHTTNKKWPAIETWFMAAPIGSRLIKDWKTEFFRANEFESMGDYADDLLSRGIDTQRIGMIDNGHYLAINLAQQYCVQKLDGSDEYRLNLVDCDSDAFKYVVDSSLFWFWGLPAVNTLCDNLEKYKSARMIKITSGHRPYLNDECIDKLAE